MSRLFRWVASVAIVVWGTATVALGALRGVGLWITLGLVLVIVGLPIVASHPLAARWLYGPADPRKTTPRLHGLGSTDETRRTPEHA